MFDWLLPVTTSTTCMSVEITDVEVNIFLIYIDYINVRVLLVKQLPSDDEII